MATYFTCKYGRGKAIHLIRSGGRAPVCGAGTSRSHAHSVGKFGMDEISCRACLKYMDRYINQKETS